MLLSEHYLLIRTISALHSKMIQKSLCNITCYETSRVSKWASEGSGLFMSLHRWKKTLWYPPFTSILSFNQQFNCRPTEIDIWLRVHSHVIGRSFVYAAKSTNQSSCRAFMYVMYRCNMSASCQYVTRYGSSPKPDSSLIPFLFFTSFVCHTSSMYSPQLQLFWTCFSLDIHIFITVKNHIIFGTEKCSPPPFPIMLV